MPKKIENEVKEKRTQENIIQKGKATESKRTIDKKERLKTGKTKKDSIKIARDTKKIRSKKEVTKNTAEHKKDSKGLEITTPEVEKTEFLQEYYDLPYRYNETVVTILAQTPKRLFVYWDISDKDKETYKKAFGDDFFEKTYPVLLIHNEELDYTFEVPINDYANSWYLDIQDSKTNYVVQLGRKFKNTEQAKNTNLEIVKEEHINFQNDFIFITDSNRLEAPNDHILFEFLSNKVTYRNVKNGSEETRELKDLVNNLNTMYPEEIIHELYTKLYSSEIARADFVRNNPGSSEFELPTSSNALKSSGQW